MKVLFCAFLCATVGVSSGASFYDKLLNDWKNYKPTQESSEKMSDFKTQPGQQNGTSKGTHRRDYINWVEKGAVTYVKNQHDCGSCWAFSATGALESRNFIKNGKLVPLSEQNLVDCSEAEGNEGCFGGTIEGAFDYVIKNHGLDTEKSYPYEGRNFICRFDNSSIGVTITKYKYVTPHNEAALKSALVAGPVSIAIDGSPKSFHLYKEGIYDDESCNSKANHAVLLVGYGYDKKEKKPYWLIKNSWATVWGDEGYIRILRDKKNICGVTSFPIYPTFEYFDIG